MKVRFDILVGLRATKGSDNSDFSDKYSVTWTDNCINSFCALLYEV